MYTVLRLEYHDLMTYLMILVDDICSNYDFLIYDFREKIFVDEGFNADSFKTEKEIEEQQLCSFIEKIGKMIEIVGLKHLMYDDVTCFEDMNIESIHIPEAFKFKTDEIFAQTTISY